MSALIKGSKSVQVVTSASDVPEGCSSETIGADIVVHLLLKGLVNVEVELAKAEKRIAQAQTNLTRMQGIISKSETPASIRASSEESVKSLEAEIKAMSLSMQQFRWVRVWHV